MRGFESERARWKGGVLEREEGFGGGRGGKGSKEGGRRDRREGCWSAGVLRRRGFGARRGSREVAR